MIDVHKRDRLWLAVSREFIRAMRGKRSQLAFSRRLGYQSKPVADWESGRRFPTVETIFKACGLVGIDLNSALGQFHLESAPEPGPLSAADIAQWLNRLRGATPISQLAELSGYPRFSVSRWLSGKTQPRLPQFFALLDCITKRTTDLIALLVDINKVPSLREEYARRRISQQIAHEEPWSAAVQRVIETTHYNDLPEHQEGWIAEYLGIPLEIEQASLSKLEQGGMIRRLHGKFRSGLETVDTKRTPEETLAIKQHWSRVATDRVASNNSADLFSYNVISVSSADADRIDGIMRAAFREIRSLVAASEPEEEVALIQLQMVRWQAKP